MVWPKMPRIISTIKFVRFLTAFEVVIVFFTICLMVWSSIVNIKIIYTNG
jgi:hypothetical protein